MVTRELIRRIREQQRELAAQIRDLAASDPATTSLRAAVLADALKEHIGLVEGVLDAVTDDEPTAARLYRRSPSSC